MKFLSCLSLKLLVYASLPLFLVLLVVSVPGMLSSLRHEEDYDGGFDPINRYSSWILDVMK